MYNTTPLLENQCKVMVTPTQNTLSTNAIQDISQANPPIIKRSKLISMVYDDDSSIAKNKSNGSTAEENEDNSEGENSFEEDRAYPLLTNIADQYYGKHEEPIVNTPSVTNASHEASTISPAKKLNIAQLTTWNIDCAAKQNNAYDEVLKTKEKGLDYTKMMEFQHLFDNTPSTDGSQRSCVSLKISSPFQFSAAKSANFNKFMSPPARLHQQKEEVFMSSPQPNYSNPTMASVRQNLYLLQQEKQRKMLMQQQSSAMNSPVIRLEQTQQLHQLQQPQYFEQEQFIRPNVSPSQFVQPRFYSTNALPQAYQESSHHFQPQASQQFSLSSTTLNTRIPQQPVINAFRPTQTPQHQGFLSPPGYTNFKPSTSPMTYPNFQPQQHQYDLSAGFSKMFNSSQFPMQLQQQVKPQTNIFFPNSTPKQINSPYQAEKVVEKQKKEHLEGAESDPFDNTPSSSPSKKKSALEKLDPKEAAIQLLIEEFDAKTDLNLKFDTLKGKIKRLILTQTGSRFLQKQLNKGNTLLVEFLLDEVIHQICDLMIDNYGNYFCQKLLLSCAPPQRLRIMKEIEKNFMRVCQDKKGTHTVQTIIDLVNLEEEEIYIKNMLTGRILALSLDPQGTHVIQKVIICFAESKRQFIFDELINNFIDISTNSNGLCVVKKLVANTTNEENIKKVVMKISSHVIELVQNPYGNYAIQTIIDNWDAELCKPIFKKLYGKVAQLSIQKFSSNVIEKCLERADLLTKKDLILEIANMDKLAALGLMKNSYGNYVVQKALNISASPENEKLAKAIFNNIPQISDKKLRTKWQFLLEKSLQETGLVLNVAELSEDIHASSDGESPKYNSLIRDELQIENSMHNSTSDSKSKGMKSCSPMKKPSMIKYNGGSSSNIRAPNSANSKKAKKFN